MLDDILLSKTVKNVNFFWQIFCFSTHQTDRITDISTTRDSHSKKFFFKLTTTNNRLFNIVHNNTNPTFTLFNLLKSQHWPFLIHVSYMNMENIFLQLHIWTNWFYSATFYDPIKSRPTFLYLNTQTYHISEVKCIANVISHRLQTQGGDLLVARNVDLFQFDWLVNRCEIVPHMGCFLACMWDTWILWNKV